MVNEVRIVRTYLDKVFFKYDILQQYVVPINLLR